MTKLYFSHLSLDMCECISGNFFLIISNMIINLIIAIKLKLTVQIEYLIMPSNKILLLFDVSQVSLFAPYPVQDKLLPIYAFL